MAVKKNAWKCLSLSNFFMAKPSVLEFHKLLPSIVQEIDSANTALAQVDIDVATVQSYVMTELPTLQVR